MSAVDALIDRLPRTTLVVGKGGVGKTTCAAALAMRASAHARTLVVSTDPARALPTVLEKPVGAEPGAVGGSKRLWAQVLDANALRSRFLERWGGEIRTILDRGTYLDDSDIGPLVDTALPGSDEIFSALALAELMADAGRKPRPATARSYSRVVVDTAPTGHTLRLLNLPRTFRALIRLLDAMQGKHRFMVQTLTRTYRRDAADAFLVELSTLVSTLETSLADPRRCVAIMVTNAEAVVVEETRRYLDSLRELRVRVAAVIWNASDAEPRTTLPAGDAEQYIVPRLAEWPVGKKGLQLWLDAIRPRGPARPRAAKQKRAARSPRRTPPSAGRPELGVLLRPLTIVAGKGGVGKTTVASALAIDSAPRYRTLVVSTDPAPSLADALAQAIPDVDTPVAGAPQLFARQMDASAAFTRLRDEYEARVDALFDALVTRGVDMSQDRSIARDLLSLAPPGIDEVYALSLLSDALFKDRYACVVVDPAPTGHLLRLLEMPRLALEWTHQLMRLMLKYKDVAGLGETAQELLDFSRNLRAVDGLLRDASRCGVVLVTLDQPVVRAETKRLATAVGARGVAIAGVILNRAPTTPALPAAEAPVHFQAPVADPPPVGVDALRRWSGSWTTSHG